MRPTTALVLGGLMAGTAAMLQLGPLYAGGFGYLLAMCASLPMVVQAYLSPRTSVWSYLAATLLLLLIHVNEAVVFAFTTAPLGLAVGYALHRRLPRWLVMAASSGVLLGGMLVLAYLVGLAPLGPGLRAWGTAVEFLIYAGFALTYGWIWAEIGRMCVTRLPHRIKGTTATGAN